MELGRTTVKWICVASLSSFQIDLSNLLSNEVMDWVRFQSVCSGLITVQQVLCEHLKEGTDNI